MIKFIPYVDLWSLEATAVVIPVNCVGIMGAGLAKQCKEKYPVVYYDYLDKCQTGALKIGKISWHQRGMTNDLICLLPTKDHFLHNSDVSQIRLGVQELARQLTRPAYLDRIKSIAIPALGCGCGKLSWIQVKPVLEEYLSDASQEIIVIEPLYT